MDVMRKRLMIDYEGTDTLATTLIETVIKEIHESAGGKLLALESEERRKIDDLEVVMPLSGTRGGVVQRY